MSIFVHGHLVMANVPLKILLKYMCVPKMASNFFPDLSEIIHALCCPSNGTIIVDERLKPPLSSLCYFNCAPPPFSHVGFGTYLGVKHTVFILLVHFEFIQ